MKINNVQIDNWVAHGEQWWDGVKEKPDELLIAATISLFLSWNEYRDLLDKGRNVPSEPPDDNTITRL